MNRLSDASRAGGAVISVLSLKGDICRGPRSAARSGWIARKRTVVRITGASGASTDRSRGWGPATNEKKLTSARNEPDASSGQRIAGSGFRARRYRAALDLSRSHSSSFGDWARATALHDEIASSDWDSVRAASGTG